MTNDKSSLKNVADEVKSLLQENDMWDGNLIGTGTHSGGIVTPGVGTYGSPDVTQHPESFYPVGQNIVDTYNSYKTTGPDDEDIAKLKHKVTPDEIITGVDYEMRKMFNKNKSRAKAIVVKNLKQDPKYYSSLHMLGVDDGDEQISENKSSESVIHFTAKAPIKYLQFKSNFVSLDNLWNALAQTRTLRRHLQYDTKNRTETLPPMDVPDMIKKLQEYDKCIVDAIETYKVKYGLNENYSKPTKDYYKPGEGVYDDSGKFLGNYIKNLTDLDVGETESDLQRLLNQEPFGTIEQGKFEQYPYYGTRRVYSDRFGSMDQALIKFLDGSPVWINVKRDWIKSKGLNESYCDCCGKVRSTCTCSNGAEHDESEDKFIRTDEMINVTGRKCERCGEQLNDETPVCEKCRTGLDNYPLSENVNIPETKRILDAMIEDRKVKLSMVNKNVVDAYKESVDARASKRNRFYDDKVNLTQKLQKEIL